MRSAGARYLMAGALAALVFSWGAFSMDGANTYYARWPRGVPSGADFFPVAVWLQSPSNARAYAEAGINLYVGLWKGPTEVQLAELAAAGMKVICNQNAVGLSRAGEQVIVGWMHDDEPDNAQPDGKGGWGPPVPPETIVKGYAEIRARDGSRPVYLNLGQGVAWDGWYGRGVRTNHPEDYAEYAKGCDIASFDIYPANCRAKDEPCGKPWYVARGVDRLRAAVGDAKPVWCWLECTKIGADSAARPTPAQVRAEVWMALVHGANGIGYFCHSWTPRFDDAALLHERPMLEAVTAINRQIRELAPALNSPTIRGEVKVESSDPAAPVDAMVKRHGGRTFVFAVAMRDRQTTATFRLGGPASVEVLGEGRTIQALEGSFTDSFRGYDVHLYRCEMRAGGR